MTRAEIKEAVYDQLDKMRRSHAAVAKDINYQMGKICGMVRAFKIAGLLDPRDPMYEEFLEDEF